jgi:hypothetical protein
MDVKAGSEFWFKPGAFWGHNLVGIGYGQYLG